MAVTGRKIEKEQCRYGHDPCGNHFVRSFACAPFDFYFLFRRKTANAAISSYRVIHTAKEKTVLIKLVDGEHMSSTDSYHKHIEKEIAIRRAAKGKGLFLALLETVRVSLTTTCFVFDSPGRKSVLVEGLNMADTLLPLKFDPLDARLGGQTDPLDEPIICQRNAAVAKPIGIFKKHIMYVRCCFTCSAKTQCFLV